MNKKHDAELVIDLYCNHKKTAYVISKLLKIPRSSVFRILQVYREGDEYKKRQREKRQKNRTYEMKYYEQVEINRNLQNEIFSLKNELEKNKKELLNLKDKFLLK